MDELFLFLDLETTGLDPKLCRILEVACILTGADFKPRHDFEHVIRFGDNPRSLAWEHVAYQMHHASGLLALVTDELEDLITVERMLHAFLSTNLGTKRANLAGNSVHFDRRFLEEHMPSILPFLTHRHLDVSSLRLAGRAMGRPKFEGKAAHRAMADVKASLVELAYWCSGHNGLAVDPFGATS